MFFEINYETVYYTVVVFMFIIILLFNKFINIFKKKSIGFNFDVRIIRGFENWLIQNLTINTTKYITETLGTEIKTEEELTLTSEFAQKGIDTVTTRLISEMPIFYRDYMTKFYGEDRLVVAIRERVRYLFIKYIENAARKRVGGNVTTNNNGGNESL